MNRRVCLANTNAGLAIRQQRLAGARTEQADKLLIVVAGQGHFRPAIQKTGYRAIELRFIKFVNHFVADTQNMRNNGRNGAARGEHRNSLARAFPRDNISKGAMYSA